jgi:hypothetical protein
MYETKVNIPLLLVVGRVLLAVVDYLALSGEWALHKGTLLLVKLAQNAQHGTLVNYTTALASPAGITGSLPPCADVGDRTSSRGDRLASDQVLFPRRGLWLFARAGSGDGDGSLAWHGHGWLYSHSGRHGGICQVGPLHRWGRDKGAKRKRQGSMGASRGCRLGYLACRPSRLRVSRC